MTADHLGVLARGAYYPPGPGYGFGLGVAVRLVPGEAPFPGSVGDWWWSGVGGTYFWVDPTEGFFAILMMQTSSAEQRQHYRTLARAMIYAAFGELIVLSFRTIGYCSSSGSTARGCRGAV